MVVVRVVVLLLAGLLPAAVLAQTPIARFIYEDAESAFAQGDYPLALTRLREAEQAFGKINPPILYLRIQARNELLKAKGSGPVDFNLLDPLRGDVRRYLKDYGGNAVLVDQVREVYQLSRELERYPADRAAYEAKLAEERRAAEQARQARQAEAERQAAERARLSAPGRIFRDCPLCPEMVVVPGGTLTVQAADGPREIEIRPFAMSRYELTWEQWYQLRGEPLPASLSCKKCPASKLVYNPHGPMGKKDRDIWGLLVMLRRDTSQSYHLPSEAQWEWACRGGERHRYCGSDTLEEVAVRGAHAPVGTKKPNGYGLYDMSGNVYEIVADSWTGNYTPPIDGGPYLGPNTPNHHVASRGGAESMHAQYFEVQTRGHSNMGKPGLRLARPIVSGLLGARLETIDEKQPRGARITQVIEGTGAAQAGLQVGDEVMQADGRPIVTQWSLLGYLRSVEAGRTVQLELVRGGQRRTVGVQLTPQVRE